MSEDADTFMDDPNTPMPETFHADLRPVLLTNIFQHARGTLVGLKEDAGIDSWFTHTEWKTDEEEGEQQVWFVVVVQKDDVDASLEACLSAMETQFGMPGREAGRMCIEQCGYVILSGTGIYQRFPPGQIVLDLMHKAGMEVPEDLEVGMFASMDFGPNHIKPEEVTEVFGDKAAMITSEDEEE